MNIKREEAVLSSAIKIHKYRIIAGQMYSKRVRRRSRAMGHVGTTIVKKYTNLPQQTTGFCRPPENIHGTESESLRSSSSWEFQHKAFGDSRGIRSCDGGVPAEVRSLFTREVPDRVNSVSFYTVRLFHTACKTLRHRQRLGRLLPME